MVAETADRSCVHRAWSDRNGDFGRIVYGGVRVRADICRQERGIRCDHGRGTGVSDFGVPRRNALEGLRQGFVDGFADGFMTGGITAGLGNVVKPGSFCFIAGTKVLIDHGHKNIEDIEVGDLVHAYDEETGETAYKPVVQLFRNTTKEWCTVEVRGGDGELYEITSTPGHKYFIPENRVRKDSRALEHASYAGQKAFRA